MKINNAFKLSALAAALSVSGVSTAVTVNDNTHVNSDWIGAVDTSQTQYTDYGSKVKPWEFVEQIVSNEGIKGALRYDVEGTSYYQITISGDENPKLYTRSSEGFTELTGNDLAKAATAIAGKNPNFGGVTESTLSVEQQESVIKVVNQDKIEYGIKTEQREAGDVKGGLFDTDKNLIEDLDSIIPTTDPKLIQQKNVELGIITVKGSFDKNGNPIIDYAVQASSIAENGDIKYSNLTANGISTTGNVTAESMTLAGKDLQTSLDEKVSKLEIQNLNEAIIAGDQETLSAANNYTDSKAAETLTAANEYTDAKAVETLASANEYTDNKFSASVNYTDETAQLIREEIAVETARLDNNVTILDNKVTSEVSRLDQAVLSNQETSRYYTDTKATETLTAAQDFTKAEDAKTLEAAKAEDVKVLASANAYTDAQIGAFGSTASRLNKRINDVEETAYRGIAIALAAQQQIPNIGAGQFAVFGGVGHYEGESAGALGLAGVLADGRTSLSAALGAAGNGEVGGRVGLAYVFGGK